jgi:aerobic-type carbon monoxide dehydrogenase small subunit (CoxS/CutS family)
MDDEEKQVTETPEPQDGDQAALAVTRRQFITGAGVGLVAGAAGAAGVITIVAPKQDAATAALTGGGQLAARAASDLPPTKRAVTLEIDGKKHDVVVDVRASLWETMVYQLGMASSNLGCDRAQCGACAVMVDGRAVNGCTVLAARLGRGQKIVTVASLNKGTRPEDLHPIQRAFWNEGGFQCGICTRGFIMSTYALLAKNANPTEAEVQEALAGNICRCGEYSKVYESVFRAADEMRKKA